MILECNPDNIINVDTARFGRFNSENCKDDSNESSTDWTCDTSSGVLEVVKDRFFGHILCFILCLLILLFLNVNFSNYEML